MIGEVGPPPRAPPPPPKTAVAARSAAGSGQLIVSHPLPPTLTAVTARQAADPTDLKASTPIPAPRPDHAAHADPIPAIAPEPPPGKPAWPIDGGSAGLQRHRPSHLPQPFTALATHVGARPLLPIAGKAVL